MINLPYPDNHADRCQAIVDILFSNAPIPQYKAKGYRSGTISANCNWCGKNFDKCTVSKSKCCGPYCSSMYRQNIKVVRLKERGSKLTPAAIKEFLSFATKVRKAIRARHDSVAAFERCHNLTPRSVAKALSPEPRREHKQMEVLKKAAGLMGLK